MRLHLFTARGHRPLRKGLTLAAGSFLLAAIGVAADHGIDRGATGARPLAIASTQVCRRGGRTCEHSLSSPDFVAFLRKHFAQSTLGSLSGSARADPLLTMGQLQSAHNMRDMEFNSYDTFAERLKDMRTLPVVTLWQSRRTQIYLGVDQKGLAGLHFCQRRDAFDTRALWHSAADAAHRVSSNDPAGNPANNPAIPLRSVAP